MKPPWTTKEVQKLTGRMAALGRFLSRARHKCLPFITLEKVKDFFWLEECQKSFEQLKQYLASSPLLTKPETGDTLYLYLTVIEITVSFVLVKEDNGVQRPIYHASKVLENAETGYQTVEKFAYAVVMSA